MSLSRDIALIAELKKPLLHQAFTGQLSSDRTLASQQQAA